MNIVTKRGGRLMIADAATNTLRYCPPDFIHHNSRDPLRKLARTPLDIADIMEYENSQPRKRMH